MTLCGQSSLSEKATPASISVKRGVHFQEIVPSTLTRARKIDSRSQPWGTSSQSDNRQIHNRNRSRAIVHAAVRLERLGEDRLTRLGHNIMMGPIRTPAGNLLEKLYKLLNTPYAIRYSHSNLIIIITASFNPKLPSHTYPRNSIFSIQSKCSSLPSSQSLRPSPSSPLLPLRLPSLHLPRKLLPNFSSARSALATTLPRVYVPLKSRHFRGSVRLTDARIGLQRNQLHVGLG